MKNGTAYAARLKKAFAKHMQVVQSVELPDPDDPIHRLAIGVLGVVNGDEFAERLVNKLIANVVSWNEVRVSNSAELQRAAGDLVDSHAPYYERLIKALQSVFDHENAMSLDRLLFMRPLPGWAHYRTPIRGLYLCGASTHPGGGVMGACGRNAAREMIRDLR